MPENTIQSDLNALIAKMSASSEQQNQNAVSPFTPVLDQNGDPLPDPVATTTAQAAPVVQSTPATPVAAPVVVDTTKEGLFEDWDNTKVDVSTPVTTEATPAVPVQPDFTEIAKALGKEKVSGSEEVAKEIASLKTTVEALNTAPENLVKAIAIAKLGGDYLDYLKVSSVDWEKEDPVILYENYVEEQFIDPKTGLTDYEEVDKFLEKMDDSEKKFKGKELQRQYVAYQRQQQMAIEQNARMQKAQFENSVKDVVNSMTDVNGFVLTPAKKSELLQYVLSGEDLKENDVRSRVVNAFIKKNFQAIDSYLKTKIKNTVTRNILEEAQVPQIKQPGEKVDDSASKKAYSVNDWIQDLKKQKGF